jgi:nuclear control of ATPase protein 2
LCCSHICRLDGQLDRIQLTSALWTPPIDDNDPTISAAASKGKGGADHNLKRIDSLQRLIKSISTTSNPTTPLSSPSKIAQVLRDAHLSSACARCQRTDEGGGALHESHYEHELEWLLLSKATTQAYGTILNTLLNQTLRVNEHIWYWDDILFSHRWATVYSLQTSPIQLWNWSKSVWRGVRMRGGFPNGLSAGWREFYVLVDDAIKDQSVAKMRSRVLSPLAQVHSEARKKQAYLKQLKDISANALGVLLGEGLEFEGVHEASEGSSAPPSPAVREDRRTKWKSSVTKSVAVLEAVLINVKDPDPDVESFETRISEMTNEDVYFTLDKLKDLRPDEVSLRLQKVLLKVLPHSNSVFEVRLQRHGRPGRLIRYWLPLIALLLSSSTILRILTNRRAEIITWLQDLGGTTIDFWNNWVVEPTRKVIGTIRHDEGSEVAIMSKRSLKGDRDSLERMVVDFAVQDTANGTLTESQVADIRAKVREGDLTPVLKAYEKDMQRPFVGAIRGNLIRALLIQIQKTKVDVEVAMGGIDSLLKSQELVFGFVGLTPGLLVTVAVARYLNGVFGNRRFRKDSKKQGQMLAVLR